MANSINKKAFRQTEFMLCFNHRAVLFKMNTQRIRHTVYSTVKVGAARTNSGKVPGKSSKRRYSKQDDKKITLSPGVRIKKYIHKTIHIHIYNFGTIFSSKIHLSKLSVVCYNSEAMSPTQNKAIVK